MPTFVLNKLIRDRVFTSMQELEQTVQYRQLNDQDFVEQLHKKLLEETAEFDPNKPDTAKELVDLLEVIEVLGKQLGYDHEALRKLQLETREKRGGFEDRTYVEKVTLNDDDPWVNYYRKEPERFKEIS